MRSRVTRRGLQSTAAAVGLIVAASSLAGCSTFGMGDDQTVTGSTGYAGASNLNQSMPPSLGARTQVAEGPYTPPEDIGDGSSAPRLPMPGQSYASLPPASSSSAITSQDLPVIGNSNGNTNAMSAQPAYQHDLPPAMMPKAAVASAPPLSVVPTATYTHVIKSGESLYTIARHYGVTAQSIMQATGISAPDKIYVGQRVLIPGRPDLLAAMDHVAAPAEAAKLPTDSSKPVVAQAEPEPMAPPLPAHHSAPAETKVASLGKTDQSLVPLAGRVLANGPTSPLPASHSAVTAAKPALTPPSTSASAPAAAPAPVKTASIAQPAPKMPLEEPAMSGADKFRWPVSGKVIVNFAASKGTGINIAAPEGTPVKAAENGTVIYVGSGVEGYGNLILIRHANGYVSAYADLKDTGVQKGAVVNRGDTIGTTGATGAVTSPQLHFELRKGATPVDPLPLLAG
jgi:murein DD-endopeptidase MepM/ murein hydrolase activator NlpD